MSTTEERTFQDKRARQFKRWLRARLKRGCRDYISLFTYKLLQDTTIPRQGSRALYLKHLLDKHYTMGDIRAFHDAWHEMVVENEQSFEYLEKLQQEKEAGDVTQELHKNDGQIEGNRAVEDSVVPWDEACLWAERFGWKLMRREVVRKDRKTYSIITARQGSYEVRFCSSAWFLGMRWGDYLERWRIIDPYTVAVYFPLDGGPPAWFR